MSENTNSFAGDPPEDVLNSASITDSPRYSKHQRVGLLVALTIVCAGIAAGIVVVVTSESKGSDSVDGNGPLETTAQPTLYAPSAGPTYSPTESPSYSPTYTPTFSPTVTAYPSFTPTLSPTKSPSKTTECTIMFGDMIDVSSPFSYVYHQPAPNSDTLVSSVYDTSFTVSPGSPTATLPLNFKDSKGNPFNIGLVSGSVSVAANGETSISAELSDPDFYINRMGALIISGSIVPNYVDPLGGDSAQAFQAAVGETPSTATATGQHNVKVWHSGNAEICTDAVTPYASCAGPWFSYTYVEVCPKKIVATRAPTHVTAPTPFSTTAPTSTTPLIDIIFTNTSLPASTRQLFENARDLWNDIIINTNEPIELPSGTVNADSLGCGTNTVFSAGTTSLAGLTIFITIGEIDGKGSTLAKAGPCAFSYNAGTPGTFGDVMPRIGVMKIDVDDILGMVNNGTMERVAMHEMGHILGIGTLWERFRVKASDPRYVGVNGVEGYRQVGGLADDIPVSNMGPGANSHWREATFADELMSDFASGTMPASLMTVKSLQDLGYVVDESLAETYSVPLGRVNDRNEGAPSATFGNDILEFNPVFDMAV